MAILLLLVSSAIFSRNMLSKEYLPFYGSVVDTVEVGMYSIGLRLQWLNDTITVNQLTDAEDQDDAFLEKTQALNGLITTSPLSAQGAQNCHSYALEMFFRDQSYPVNQMFNCRISIQPESYVKILRNSFEQVQEFRILKDGKLPPDTHLDDGVILVFYDDDNDVIHSAFYRNGITYSKNGVSQPSSYSNIDQLLELYWDTKYIREYAVKGQ